jgi:ABC-type transport system substrate-binding protein
MIYPSGGRVLGYYPEMGPTDSSAAFPAIERMMEMTPKRSFEPFLAEDVDIDRDKLTMTFHIRKGIRFHDGSPFNAEAAAWNYQLLIDKNKIQYGEQIKKVEVVDDLTLVLHLSSYHNQMVFSYGWVPMFSKVAFETKGVEWCRTHPVGTGPFKMVEWKRDAYLIWVKNEDYWQKGKPYLDGIDVRYIPDPVTASSMMQAGEADIWLSVPVKDQAELVKKGLKRQAYWPALPRMLYLNTKNPNAITANFKVREAIEYSIDRAAIAKAVGFGYYMPLKMTAPPGEWGYDPAYDGRPYNPEKARALLAEAGYPKGVNIKLTAMAVPPWNLEAEAVSAYMRDVGFKVKVDLADPGRFFSSAFGKGWDDIILFFTGLDENYLATIQAWLGHEPKTNLASFKRSPELLAMSKESVTYLKKSDQAKITRKMTRLISEQALVIPLYSAPAAYILHPYVHTDYYTTGFIRWKMFDMWMDKR